MRNKTKSRLFKEKTPNAVPIRRELPLYPQIGNKKMSLGVPTSHGNTSQITKVNVLPLTWHQCYCLHRPMGEKKVCVYKCIFL